ncbi:MAG TPA: CorA family divalent cation transporter [Microlunatus sp.]|nr:CorA family divalent cation transporter [Microlunatus sp.]
MDVRVIGPAGVEHHDPSEVPELLRSDVGVVWVDIPVCDSSAAEFLHDAFGFHPVAVRDCVQRNHISKMHVYADHVFVVLHAPEVGERGHVHYVELDQFIGQNYLVTVHGPLNPTVDPRVAAIDTGTVLQRVEQRPGEAATPFALSHLIVSSLIRRELDLVATLAQESGRLEQQVMLSEERENPEAFLAQLFQAWYVLLAVRTMAMHSAASYDRLARWVQFSPKRVPKILADIADQFVMVQTMADGQREFLHGVIEFYQTLISTHMTVAAEQSAKVGIQQNDDMRKISAWVAIAAVPAAVTGFFGQNVPYPGFDAPSGLIASSTLIILLAVGLFLIFKKKRWL